jgi:alpha-ribazole phosphatase
MNLTLWLIRHGSSTLSGTGQWQGWLDVGLSAGGQQQAMQSTLTRELPLTNRVFASPLRRCMETCELMFPNTPVTSDWRLQTRNLGDWEGLTTEQIKQQGGSWYSPFAQQSPPNGESLEEVCIRLESFLADISQLHGPQVAVTHGAIIGLVLEKLNIEPIVIPPCSFVVIENVLGSWRLKRGPIGSVPPV